MSTLGSIELLLIDANRVRAVVGLNIADVTHEQSVMHPEPGGNSANWVLGHLLTIYCAVSPLLGQAAVIDNATIAQYMRGSTPLAAADALPLERLKSLWSDACDAMQIGLNTLDPARLGEPSPFSPSGNPNETIHTLLHTVMFHQTYHSGQLGLLRRIMGHKGAIA